MGVIKARFGILMVRSLFVKIIVLWTGLFPLLVIEDEISLAGVTLSNIWKISLLGFCSLLFVSRIPRNLPGWQCFLSIIILSLPFGVDSGFSILFRDLVPVLCSILFFYWLFNSSLISHSRDSETWIAALSIFFITSALPFASGLLVSSDLSLQELSARYGSDHSTLVGFFKHPSIAGKVFAFSSAILLFFSLQRYQLPTLIRVIFLSVGLLGCYFTYLSYVRTAWIMLAIMIVYGAVGIKFKLKNIVLLVCFFSLLATLVIFEPGFVNRVLNLKAGVDTPSGAAAYSSGRLVIWAQILLAIVSQAPASLVVGLGGGGYSEHVGQIYAHSLIVQIFAFSGGLGLVAFSAFIAGVTKFIRVNSVVAQEERFMISLVLTFLCAALLSHGIEFYGSILFGAMLSTIRRRRIELELGRT